jgi:hypothetical protein
MELCQNNENISACHFIKQSLAAQHKFDLSNIKFTTTVQEMVSKG